VKAQSIERLIKPPPRLAPVTPSSIYSVPLKMAWAARWPLRIAGPDQIPAAGDVIDHEGFSLAE
jgi:hypothetical protein